MKSVNPREMVTLRLEKHARSLSRRRFIGGLGGAALFALGAGNVRAAQHPGAVIDSSASNSVVAQQQIVSLPPLPYAYNALEPHIDEMTMMIHHTRHHNAFITTLNNTLPNYPELQGRSITDLVYNIDEVPEAIRTVIRNNGGGHLNHSIFWATMAPNAGGEPSGDLAQAINGTFGNFATFKQQLTAAAAGRFGSGWGWLVMDGANKLMIMSTPNQDSPYMMGYTPLLGVDVWEHSYYLKYQNRRADYLAAWWNVINWDAVAQRHAAARV